MPSKIIGRSSIGFGSIRAGSILSQFAPLAHYIRPPSSAAMDLCMAALHSAIRFSSESPPDWLRNSLWWTSRLDIEPHDWHLQPSRRSTWLRSCSYMLGLKPQGCAFRSNRIHDAFSVTWCRNVCFSSPGRNLKNRRRRLQENIGIFILQIRSRQEVCTDHFQAIAPGFVAAQHQSCRFDRLLNDRDLALVQLEIR